MIPIRAQIIIPHVYIDQEAIDFGGITQGNTAYEPFTLINESPIALNLYLDLRNYPELEISITSSWYVVRYAPVISVAVPPPVMPSRANESWLLKVFWPVPAA